MHACQFDEAAFLQCSCWKNMLCQERGREGDQDSNNVSHIRNLILHQKEKNMLRVCKFNQIASSTTPTNPQTHVFFLKATCFVSSLVYPRSVSRLIEGGQSPVTVATSSLLFRQQLSDQVHVLPYGTNSLRQLCPLTDWLESQGLHCQVSPMACSIICSHVRICCRQQC